MFITKRLVLCLLFCLFMMVASRVASAQSGPVSVSPPVIIPGWNNGDPANRLDLVILGDGYTAGQISQFQSDVNNFVAGLFGEDPYKEYKRYFNVHRIDVVSYQSGADHPEFGTTVDTAFNASFDFVPGSNPPSYRALTLHDPGQVYNILFNYLQPTEREVILVLVNDSTYGGTGGAIATSSTNSLAVEVIKHELGHTLGLLADEYNYGSCVLGEPPEPNVTAETNRAFIKWTYWIDASTPIPTTSTSPGVPGLYEGAKYCAFGLYRPTYNSKMNSLGLPFEQINTEQLIRRVYNYVTPLDSSSPAGTDLTLTPGQVQNFSVTTPSPFTHNLGVTWFLDGQQKTTGTTYALNTNTVNAGPHSIQVLVKDTTGAVRSDPEQRLVANRTWYASVGTGPSLSNLALNKPASQSSTAAGYGAVAGRAVDGNTSGNFADGSVTHTNDENHPWWEVNLGAIGTINYVQIYNRTDCCSERLINYYLFVSDQPFTSTDPAQTINQPGVTNSLQQVQAASPTTIQVNRTGQYVRVQLADNNFLHIAEVQVWGTASGPPPPTNLALNKTATQSSTAAGYGAVAGRAVDGNTSGNWTDGSVTHTDYEAQPWWHVDLAGVGTIQTIKIFNRTDCCGDRLNNYYVFVSDNPFQSLDPIQTQNQAGVSTYFQTVQAGSPTTLTVNRTGRYVRVQLSGTNYLHIAEVQVWGTISGPPPPTNLALNQPATQSTTAAQYGAVASRAVDGNTNGDWAGGSVTHTDYESQPWWHVDIGAVKTIQNIQIYNRTDCCSDRLSDYYVFVSDVPFTSTNLQQTINQPGVLAIHQTTQAGSPSVLSVNRTGRYVRIQLTGTNYLHIAEVQVWGIP